MIYGVMFAFLTFDRTLKREKSYQVLDNKSFKTLTALHFEARLLKFFL